MELLNKEVREVAKKKFEDELVNKVTILFFTQEQGRLIVPGRLPTQECMFCRETRQLYEEVASLSDKIELRVHDFVGDKKTAEEYGVDKIPAAVVMGEKDHGIRFFGIPSGYEFQSLIEAIIDVSKGTTSLGGKTREALALLEKDVRIQVFVTPTCPYCTMAVRLAHQMALESPRVTGEMIEATEFPHLGQKYNVYGVPKTVMNETVTVDGAVPEDIFLGHVLKASGKPQS
jgi:glutaredoxin-like protein